MGPSKSELLGQVNDYADLTEQLLAAVEASVDRASVDRTTAAGSRPAEAILDRILALDARLRSDLYKVEVLDQAHGRLEAAKASSAAIDGQVTTLLRYLREAEASLSAAVDTAQLRVKAMRQAEQSNTTVDALISYARRVSYTTAPPPQFNGTGSFDPCLPPAPGDDQMRQSLFGQRSFERQLAMKRSRTAAATAQSTPRPALPVASMAPVPSAASASRPPAPVVAPSTAAHDRTASTDEYTLDL